MYLNYNSLTNSIKPIIYNIYHSTWCVEKIVDICLKKSQEDTLNPFFVNTVGSIIQRVYIKSGYFYESFLKELVKNTFNSQGVNKYRLLDECNQRLIEQIGLNLLTLKEEKCERDVDLLFQDVCLNKVYYFEIKKRDNQDSTKKEATIRKFLDTKKTLERTYSNLESFIVFIEKDKVLKYNNLDSKYILSGNDFYKKFFNLKINDVNSYLKKLIDDEYLKQLYKNAENIIEEFLNKSKILGNVNAANFILVSNKKR